MPSLEEYLSHFPFPNIRDNQREVIKQTQEAIEEGKRIIVVEAPTGFGKSAYAVCLANTLGRAFFVTSTKDLQEQYLNDFPQIKLVKGRNNFDCRWLLENPKMQEKLQKQQKENSLDEMFWNKNGMTRLRIIKPTADHGDCTVNRRTKCPYYISKKRYFTGQTTPSGVVCKYYQQKFDGAVANQTIYNYKYFLPTVLYQDDFEPRNVVIFDECHKLENEIKDFLSLTVDTNKLDDLIGNHYKSQYEKILQATSEEQLFTTDNWLSLLEQVHSEMSDVIKSKSQELELLTGSSDIEDAKMMIKGMSPATTVETVATTDDVMGLASSQVPADVDAELIQGIVKEVTYATQLQTKIDTFLADISYGKSWVVNNIIRSKDGKEVRKVMFVPTKVGSTARKIFETGEVIVLMSATILDHIAFCESIGLAKDEVKFISVGTEFPVANRPIHCLNVEKLDYENLQKEEVQKKIVDTINAIMEKHSNQKGIIHATSISQMRWILQGLSDDNRLRIITTPMERDSIDDEMSREQVVKHHKENSRPTVLLSASLYEGLDLKHDLARFAIILKIPWPDSKDRWIKAKMTGNWRWYTWQAGLRLVQAYGRTVRDKEDWAITYVLDSGVPQFCVKNKAVIPQWVREAIRVHDSRVNVTTL